MIVLSGRKSPKSRFPHLTTSSENRILNTGRRLQRNSDSLTPSVTLLDDSGEKLEKKRGVGEKGDDS
jgi:hypothetical protein